MTFDDSATGITDAWSIDYCPRKHRYWKDAAGKCTAFFIVLTLSWLRSRRIEVDIGCGSPIRWRHGEDFAP